MDINNITHLVERGYTLKFRLSSNEILSTARYTCEVRDKNNMLIACSTGILIDEVIDNFEDIFKKIK